MLATAPVAEAYSYLDPGAYVLHPVGMRPVQALRHLRLGEEPWAAAFGEDPGAAAGAPGPAGRARWWSGSGSGSTLARVQRDNERLFRRLLWE